jgi:type 1 glutamine amidotransferase
MSGRINAVLVVGGKWHDFDYARLELLKLLATDPRIRTQVSSDYENTALLDEADVLVAYTCDVRPSMSAQQAIKEWVEAGGRMFALHATNSAIDGPDTFGPDFETPDAMPVFSEVLGSRFLSHPAIEPYPVHVSPGAENDPLVEGIPTFHANDELYLSKMTAPVEPLLETRWTGTTQGFATGEWPNDDPRYVMYRRPLGAGCVLYFTLGHCRSHWDMKDAPFHGMKWPSIDRGSWELEEYHELLRRGLTWAIAPAVQRVTLNPAPEMSR